MKFIGAFLGTCAFFAWTALGQVTVEVRLDQEQYLPNEDLQAAVRITNFSGQTLHLGRGSDWLTFSIDSRDRNAVLKLGEIPVEEDFSLESSMAATARHNLTPYFNFQQPGRYTVTARVRIPQWGTNVASKPVPFEVITGTKLREFEVGLPTHEDRPPEVRRFIIQQASYLKELRLYVRLTDASRGHTYKVLQAGPIVSFGHPEAQVDHRSRLHLLHQTGARTFTYNVVSPLGEVLTRQTHEYTASRPVLRLNAEGQIIVAGGARRLSPSDIPSSTASVSSSQPRNASE